MCWLQPAAVQHATLTLHTKSLIRLHPPRRAEVETQRSLWMPSQTLDQTPLGLMSAAGWMKRSPASSPSGYLDGCFGENSSSRLAGCQGDGRGRGSPQWCLHLCVAQPLVTLVWTSPRWTLCVYSVKIQNKFSNFEKIICFSVNIILVKIKSFYKMVFKKIELM